MEIQLGKDFLGIEGKALKAEKECCIQKSNGKLAEVNGQLVTVMVPTPDKKLELRKICINALLNEFPNEQTDPDEKYKKYLLFQKFHNAKNKIELESKEVTLVKNVIGKSYGTLIVGQAWDMLEGK